MEKHAAIEIYMDNLQMGLGMMWQQRVLPLTKYLFHLFYILKREL